MSREIKFRAWDKKHRKYAKVLKVYFGSDGHILGTLVEDYDTNYALELRPDQVELEQYTGLKDKNGKEIYEGDIVKFGIYGDEKRGYVGYADEFASCEVYSKMGFVFGGLFGHAGEVIGNIHENPELLNPRNSTDLEQDDSLHGPYGPIGEENIGGESRRIQK